MKFALLGLVSVLCLGISSANATCVNNNGAGEAVFDRHGKAVPVCDGAAVNAADKRLQNVMGAYYGGLEEISGLRPVRYKYRDGAAGKEYVGLVAQDVKDYVPEAVSVRDDGYYDVDTKSLSYTMINAIKQLKAENDYLKEQNEFLMGDVARLKAVVGLE